MNIIDFQILVLLLKLLRVVHGDHVAEDLVVTEDLAREALRDVGEEDIRQVAGAVEAGHRKKDHVNTLILKVLFQKREEKMVIVELHQEIAV